MSSPLPPFKKYEHSTGVSVKERTSEMKSAIAIVTAKGLNIFPSMPVNVMSGINTRIIMPTPNRTGLPTSVADSNITRSLLLDLSCPSRWNVFSTTTTEPSTMRPIAIVRPPSDIRFAEIPK